MALIILKSGHIISPAHGQEITFESKSPDSWSNTFRGSINNSDGKVIETSDQIHFRREDAICYS